MGRSVVLYHKLKVLLSMSANNDDVGVCGHFYVGSSLFYDLGLT